MNHHDISLPHHRLHVWELALQLVRLVHATSIHDAECRVEARASAKSCARNIAEAAGRRSRADQRRGADRVERSHRSRNQRGQRRRHVEPRSAENRDGTHDDADPAAAPGLEYLRQVPLAVAIGPAGARYGSPLFSACREVWSASDCARPWNTFQAYPTMRACFCKWGRRRFMVQIRKSPKLGDR